MRHSIFADDAICVPGIPWGMLARTARAGRSERVCFRNGGFPHIDPAPEKPRVPRSGSSSAPKFKIRRILDERLLAAAIMGLKIIDDLINDL